MYRIGFYNIVEPKTDLLRTDKTKHTRNMSLISHWLSAIIKVTLNDATPHCNVMIVVIAIIIT